MDANEHELKDILAGGETLMVEFKSDDKGLPDRDLVAAVVAMTNTEGGLILLGVEDDGTVTGVQPNHQDSAGLIALIANRTNPSVSVRADVIEWARKKVLRDSGTYTRVHRNVYSINCRLHCHGRSYRLALRLCGRCPHN